MSNNKCHDCDVECEAVKLRERAERAEAQVESLRTAQVTHYCAGCEDRQRTIDELSAQVERLRGTLGTALLWCDDAMRTTIITQMYAVWKHRCDLISAALSESPAQDLARHDGAVRAQAWREAAMSMRLTVTKCIEADGSISTSTLIDQSTVAELLERKAAEAERAAGGANGTVE